MVQKADIMHEYIETNNITEDVVLVENHVEAVNKLSRHQAEAALTPVLLSHHIIKKHNIKNIRIIEGFIEARKYCFAVKKGNETLVNLLNEGLSVLRKNGSYDDIMNKWFDSSSPSSIKLLTQFLKDIWYILVLILLSISAWIWSLYKAIKKQLIQLKEDKERQLSYERKILEQRDYFSVVFNSVSQGVLTTNSAGEIILLNSKAREMIGLPFDEMIGKLASKIILLRNYYSGIIVNLPLEDVLASGEEVNSQPDTILLSAKGNLYHINYSVTPLKDSDGTMNGVTIVLEDNTVNYLKNLELNETNKKFRIFIESLPYMILIWRDDRWTYCNPAFTATTGIQIDQLDRVHFIINESGDLERKIGIEEEVTLNREKTEIMVELEGHERWFIYRLQKIDFFHHEATMLTAIEITQQKKNEAIKELIYEISALTYKTTDKEDFFRRVYLELKKLIDLKNIFIALVDETEENIYIPFIKDENENQVKVPLEGTLSALVIRDKSSKLFRKREIEDLIKRGEAKQVGTMSEAWLGVPLIVEEKVIGLICVQNYDAADAISDEEKRLLEYLSYQIAVSIEQKMNELSLRESEEKFRLLAENIPGVIYVYDVLPNGKRKTIYYGPGLENLLGENCAARVKGNVDEFFTYIHKDDIERLFEKSEESDKMGINLDVEYRLVSDNNNEVWVRSISSSLNIKDGVTRIYGVLINIDKQKKAETKLIETKAFLDYSLNQSLSGIIIVDDKSEIQFINQAAMKLLGVSDQYMVNMGFNKKWKMFDTDGKQLELEELPVSVSIIENKEVRDIELKVVLDDQSEKWLLNNACPIYDSENNLLGGIAVITDISRIKEIEQTIVTEKRKFESLAENVLYGLVMIKNDDEITYVNSRFTAITGFELGEVRNSAEWFEKAYPDKKYRDEVLAYWSEACKLVEKSPVSSNFQITRKDGQKRDVNIIMIDVKNNSRLISIEDITERVKYQEKMIEAQKMDSIGHLAGGVAHDFNNMLGGISGFTSLLLMKEEDEERKELLNGILTAVKRSASLTQKLLAFGRRGKNLAVPISLNDVVNDVVSILERTIAKNVHITKELRNDLFMIDSDPSQINQVIMNICVNAVEAMPDGGELRIHTDNVDSSALNYDFTTPLSEKNYAFISISDTGIGMSDETKSHIFEPFFTTKFEGHVKGTGLGLATVYGIVKNNGGFIEVESEYDKGTSFIICFPRGHRSKVEEEKSEHKIVKAEKGTILIIDDEDIIRSMISKMIKTLGYSVLTAENGKLGIDIYEKNQSDINAVVLDIKMPVMGGKDTLIALKKIQPGVKVVISSGYGQNEEAQELLDMGAKRLIAKPFDIATLSDALNQALTT
ncbi:MAG: PAS domain S-box protein [Candidatus Cloacimonetes bacterium]|nr:PAS domain S-box protein [Candidatus Cloacimonadota bacterium]